ncbi:Oxidoreductase, 2OG-Fe(II) oxygenase family protein [Minicystis rosea]|nr:Oxidoreductase, 2OG-Fe(II) oxygenase family protein [Minicystis rosea]
MALQIGRACRAHGFFYVVGHGVDEALQVEMDRLSRRFFALDRETKLRIRMERGGRAWRGYFPVGGELTSGKPDWKEGIYFGAELADDHPLVKAGTPLHGRNLFPAEVPALRDVVLAYMDALTGVGHLVMEGIARSLGLPASYFADRYTGSPLILFRIFNYPPPTDGDEETWGVGEHTDYGLMTLLGQDDAGGLQVKSGGGWIEAPPVPGSFVCNIGDMLDRMTGGLYRSTPHRVRNAAGRDRLSFPFFFDPGFDVEVKPIAIPGAETIAADAEARWDGSSVHAFQGTYGEYLLGKVGKVFPALRREVL